MAVARDALVDNNFSNFVRSFRARALRDDLDQPVRAGAKLTARRALAIFQAQLTSRHCDLLARALKREGDCYYTIGSSGHEGNAAVAMAFRHDDPAFLHYRSGGFFCARTLQAPGTESAFDVVLGLVASSDEPIAGGRHKVFGSVNLHVPPQTSTIASQLPKALGCAVAIDRRARFSGLEDDRVVVCSFGDASANHSTASGAIHAAGWAAFQNIPVPLVFVCEDNGLGISVRTPTGWIAAAYQNRAGMHYISADGLDMADTWDRAAEAVAYAREKRRPVFLHVRTVRLLGHAGSDVELLYRSKKEIEQAEAQDPLMASAALLIREGWLTPDDVLAMYEETRATLRRMGDEAKRRAKITTRSQVMEPLFQEQPVAAMVAPEARRLEVFKNRLPELEDRTQRLAVQLNRTLTDLMAAEDRVIVFGEDVARKGGVYHVTADLMKRFGVGRVFNTLLDEQSILGMAIGAGHAGLLPFPEIQYLAYLMNAIDQLRGEAGSMQFFSQGQYANPMVVRIAGLAYQKGFGGHFHNDNGIAALREIPGLLIGCPSRGDDAARMLRAMAARAQQLGRVCVLLEPIALYHTKDLHEEGDGLWLTTYPAPDALMPLDEVGVYHEGDPEAPAVTVVSYANGLWMSLRVAHRLAAEGHNVRVIDLRWLAPLPIEAILPHASAAGKVLVVDECRANSGIADHLAVELHARDSSLKIVRITGADTYVPLGAAANLVLVQEPEIEAGLRTLLEDS
ncbi:MAG: thiamine pyrophosphate-dependent enzyme [Myxococcota bacterium]